MISLSALLLTTVSLMTTNSTITVEETLKTTSEKLCPGNSCEDQIKRLKRHGVRYKNPHALILLSTAYLTGEGVEKNEERAYKLMKQAAASRSSKAFFILSVMLKDGVGTKVNKKRAQKYLDRSAKRGYPPAMLQKALETLDFTKPRNDEAINWLEKAAKSNHKEAAYLLAQLKETGIGVEKNLLEAANYYKRSAFWDFKDSNKRLQHIAKTVDKNNKDYLAISKLAEDVETITIFGNKKDFSLALDLKIDAITIDSIYDGNGIGPRIPGGCQARSMCAVVYVAGSSHTQPISVSDADMFINRSGSSQ